MLSVAMSRRTSGDIESAILEGLSGRISVIKRDDREGFVKLLHSAARFVVTPDLITMTCEACTTGQPVAFLNLPAYDTNNATYRFAQGICKAGYVSWNDNIVFENNPPLRETERIAAELQTVDPNKAKSGINSDSYVDQYRQYCA